MQQPGPPSKRTRVVREPHRGVYDRATCYAILDDAMLCHVGFEVDGQPFVIPTLFARVEDDAYFHGSAASRMLRHAGAGARACLTVTIVDGVVLARSVFNHSMNYRSVVALGVAQPVLDADEKRAALRAFTEKLLPGRWAEAREPTANELAATSVLRLPLDEMSGKSRSGAPQDAPEDLSLPVWTGVIPISLVAGAPMPDDASSSDASLPASVLAYISRRSGSSRQQP